MLPQSLALSNPGRIGFGVCQEVFLRAGVCQFFNFAYRIFLSSRLTPWVSPFSSRHSQTHCMYPAYILCTVWLHCICVTILWHHICLATTAICPSPPATSEASHPSHSPHTSHPPLWQAGCSPPPHTNRKICQKHNCHSQSDMQFGMSNVDVDIMSYLRHHHHQDFVWKPANGRGVMSEKYFEKILHQRNILKKFPGCFTGENGFLDTPGIV